MTRRGALVPAADALAAAGLTPVELAAKEGLALINGTDGMLGMLVLAITDLRRLLRTADIAAAMSVEGQLAHRPRLRAPSCRRSGRIRARRSRPPTWSRCSPTPAWSPRTAGPTATGCRTPTRCAARRRCTARPATPSSTPPRWPSASSRRPSTTRWCCPRRGASSPTATSTAPRSPTCSTSSRSSPPTSPRSASGVPTGSSTRPAATGCRRSSPTTRASTAGT